MNAIQIVWFKRDLRIRDHRPLAEAAASGSVFPLYVFEPDLWQQPEWDETHFRFVSDSLKELDHGLQKLGLRLTCRVGDVVDVMADIRSRHEIVAVHSHEEVGGKWTFDRDLRVGGWLRSHGIPWLEYPQCGVMRGLRNRDGWASHWKRWMGQPQAEMPARAMGIESERGMVIPNPSDIHVRGGGDTACQAGGESNAHTLLDSFLQSRGRGYRTAMSSPRTAESQCSRLSPYIAWGCITIKQVHQAVRAKMNEIAEVKSEDKEIDRGFSRSLTSYQSRLSWHCHFMQKLDDEPELEFHNLNRAYDGMREDDFRSDYFDRWCQGRTGYPMIDACMRYLHHHLWINFRMRAMLMSFAAYHLWLHWREPAVYLARHFLDFEPGIHFPQVQMQSGVTGINTIRIYSPVKQAMDQDPDGAFVRRWIPELEHVPKPWIFEPWKMGNDDQVRFRCRIDRDYPSPIVDHRDAVSKAKERIYALRRSEQAMSSAQRVYEKHGSRKNRDPLPTKRKRSPSIQQPWLPGLEEDISQ
ncbi:MAG: deoxyribodipyrimidine photo-lyase/cryptochrome family protein [Planctomycetota bacterium]